MGEEQRKERDRKNLKQAPRSAWSPTWGAISQPWDHDLSQTQELDTQPTEPPRHHPLPFFLIELWLTYDTMLLSDVQNTDSTVKYIMWPSGLFQNAYCFFMKENFLIQGFLMFILSYLYNFFYENEPFWDISVEAHQDAEIFNHATSFSRWHVCFYCQPLPSRQLLLL